MSTIKNNGEILYLYDARMCNPNGDPDDENRPRMDMATETNLVTDVRLKRYIRDYLGEKGYTIFVTKAEGVVIAGDRLKQVLGKDKQPGPDDLPELLKKLIDVRMFGATMPIKGERRGEGESLSLIGPIQFNWGYSLNRVELVDTNAITSQFASEAQAKQGTIGRDFRVYYSLLAFHGIVSAARARLIAKAGKDEEGTALSAADLALLDEAMLKAIPLFATRSKIGQYPRLYLRFIYKDAETFIGDLRDELAVEPERGLRSISDYKLVLDKMIPRLKRAGEKVEKVLVWQSPQLVTTASGGDCSVKEVLEEIFGRERVEELAV